MNCSFAEALIPLMTNPHRYLTSNGQKNLTSIACRHLALNIRPRVAAPGPSRQSTAAACSIYGKVANATEIVSLPAKPACSLELRRCRKRFAYDSA